MDVWWKGEAMRTNKLSVWSWAVTFGVALGVFVGSVADKPEWAGGGKGKSAIGRA